MRTPIYFNGDGSGYIAPSATPKVLRNVGNVTGLQFTPKVTTFDHIETSTGDRSLDFSMIDTKEGDIQFSLEGFDRKNLALQFLGTDTTKAAGTVTGETLPAALVAGDMVALDNQRVSALVIKDSAVSAATLVLGTDYTATADELEYGRVEIKNVTGLTQPLKADYAYGASIPVTFMSTDMTPYYLRLEGLNRANAKKKFLVEFWRVLFTTVKDIEFITEKGIWKAVLSGKLLGDPSKAADPELGIFGRITLLEDAV